METIDCILRDMRKCAADCTSSGCRDMDRFADRIEAAYKRNRAYQESKCAANEELARKLTKQRDINKELVDENARLIAALANAKTIICNWCKSNWRCCPNGSEDKCEVIGEINGLLSVNAVDDSVNGHKVAFDDIEWELSTIKKENDE